MLYIHKIYDIKIYASKSSYTTERTLKSLKKFSKKLSSCIVSKMKYCVVKNCNSGLKNLKVKRSIFKVPKDVELRKKWAAAIPGISVLGYSSCVCERHFKSDDIIREKHFKNNSGVIIGVVCILFVICLN